MTETGLNTMIGEAAKSIQESGGKHVGVFEAKIIMAGRVLIVLTLIAVGSLLIYQVGVGQQQARATCHHLGSTKPPPPRLELGRLELS